MKEYENTYTIALAGNPNVGKSTVFNSFTGMRQHTGNWPGKTVDNAQGEYIYNGSRYIIQDLPGTYSLVPNSAEEEVTCDYIKAGKYDALVVVLDATTLCRNLRFALQILEYVGNAVLCVNLIDEAEKKGIFVDTDKLSECLGVPAVPTAARSGKGLSELKSAIESTVANKDTVSGTKRSPPDYEELYKSCCHIKGESIDEFDRRLDKMFISKKTGVPVMLLLLGFIFWLTIVGSNYPSQWLSSMFSTLGAYLRGGLEYINCNEVLISALVDGVYTTLTWIVSVMLPPMAIFFPLFTLLEDSGYLPRMAFNMDSFFQRANAHGKQALTISMGFGCNACGVTGCRIIDSPRERLIAIITNSLVPCNGRFPTLIYIISMFIVVGLTGFAASFVEALVLLALIVLSVVVTLICSRLLSKTVLKGVPSSFVLELPPYRKPQIGKVIVRSIRDRTVFVLLRAAAIAAPAGLIIWLLANITVGDRSILLHCTEFLDPVGTLLGLDGAILIAFILGFPANEVVLPIILMVYMSCGSISELPNLVQLKEILAANGWTLTTALCMMIFVLFHFPCSTTLITVYKETKSIAWTLASFLTPLLIGVVLCLCVSGISGILTAIFI